MATADQVRADYSKSASKYNNTYSTLPVGVLESQILEQALSNIADATVLDLGGGSGTHAREAIDAGAARVDIVDISPEMMKIARDVEASLGREHRIRTFEADVSKSMEHLQLGTYDIVMANWVFDHAGSMKMLEGMWSNVERHLKPGGMFLGIRSGDLRGPAYQGKYGVRTKNIREIPGGFACTVEMLSEQPWEFEAATMQISFSGSFEMHEKYGLEDLRVLPYSNAEAIRSDPEFWQLFLENPAFAVVQGRKRKPE
jgi:SAM-dependent methyltransferase